MPASHGVPELAPAPHQPPASHASHAFAPTAAWKVPASHGSAAAAPSTYSSMNILPFSAVATAAAESAPDDGTVAGS